MTAIQSPQTLGMGFAEGVIESAMHFPADDLQGDELLNYIRENDYHLELDSDNGDEIYAFEERLGLKNLGRVTMILSFDKSEKPYLRVRARDDE